MEKTLWNSDWYCIVCSKHLINIFLEKGSKFNNPDSFPVIEGGTAQISFGYGSRYDQIENLAECTNYKYIACICDDCFSDKKSLIKKVRLREKTEFDIVN